MTVAALDMLRDAFAALRIALDGDDANALDAAAARVRDATAHLRAAGAWRDEPAVRERLKDMMPVIESARIHANVLQDHTRQRIDILAAHGVQKAPLTYGR